MLFEGGRPLLFTSILFVEPLRLLRISQKSITLFKFWYNLSKCATETEVMYKAIAARLRVFTD